MKVRFTNHWHQLEIEPEDIELERSCPACSLGRTASGAPCSVCNGTGMMITMLGVRLLDFLDRNIKAFRAGHLSDAMHYVGSSLTEAQRRTYGKSLVAPVAKVPEINPPKASATNKAQVKGDGSKAPTLPRPAPQLSPRTSSVRSVSKTVPKTASTAISGHPPQKRSWEIP